MRVQLIFVRHAHALDPAAGQKDFDRSLSNKGRQQANALGMFLVNKFLYASRISLVSPAVRTSQTYELAFGRYAEHFETRYEPLFFNGSIGQMEDIIQTVLAEAGNQLVVIVGHNPAISFLAERFGYEAGNPFHTATAVSVMLESSEGGRLVPEKTLWRFDFDGAQ